VKGLTGTVTVITGAGSGIGRATALSLARRGGHVVVTDIDESRALAVAREVTATGSSRGLGLRCDVADLAAIEAARDAALATFGRLDIVMSNVGILAKGMPLEIPLEGWEAVIDVNLLGTVRVLSTFLPILVEQGSGHLVTTGSVAGLFPYAYDRLPYAATKAAVVTLTEALALYLEPLGVGVSCFCPAGVATNISEQVREYGPPAPLQAPPVPVISAEQAGELVVKGILDRQLLIHTHPVIQELMAAHGADRQSFLQARLAAMAAGAEGSP
jgi:NAD(P)-dependent dehydrogenase (short-subunit alcohol dehydrogenase family)